MTPLRKPVTRKSDATVRDGSKRRALVVTLYPNDTIGLRPEKTRREEIVPLDAIYSYAVKARVRTEQRAKAEAKKAKKQESRELRKLGLLRSKLKRKSTK